MQAGLELEKEQAEAKEVVAVSDPEAAVPVRTAVVGHLVSAVLVLECHDREHPSPGGLHHAHVAPHLSLAAAHLPRAALPPPVLDHLVFALAIPGPVAESTPRCTLAPGPLAR